MKQSGPSAQSLASQRWSTTFPTRLRCAVTDVNALSRAIKKVGHPRVVVHNAGGGAFGAFDKIDATTLNRDFQINAMALFHLARLTAPAMVEVGEGAIIVTGNTSAQRGRAAFAGFAPTKATQRILAESLARDLGPKGVHFAYPVIDAAIDVPWQRQLQPDKPDDFFISPRSIAAEVFHLAHQPTGPFWPKCGHSTRSGR